MIEHILATIQDIPQTSTKFIPSDKLWIPEGSLFIGERQLLDYDYKYYQFKQLIPYIVIKKGNTYLTYKRTKMNGESRLSEKYSMGFGGHINISDIEQQDGNIKLQETLFKSTYRELKEELNEIDSLLHSMNSHFEPLGYIYNNLNETDRVHLGIIYILETEQTLFTTTDEGLSEISFKTLDEIQALSNLESWSQIVCNILQSFYHIDLEFFDIITQTTLYYNDPITYYKDSEDYTNTIQQYTETDYACDCKRYMLLYNTNESEYPCSNHLSAEKILLKKITIRESQEVIYNTD